MTNELEPIEENWYYDLEQNHHIMVVAVDEASSRSSTKMAKLKSLTWRNGKISILK